MKKKILLVLLAFLISGCSKKEFIPYVTLSQSVFDLNEEFDPLKVIVDSEKANLVFEVKDSNVDTSVPGDYEITYVIYSANRKNSVEKTYKIIVKDNDAPVLTVNDSIELFIGEPFSIEKYASAYDQREGDLTDSIHFSGVVNNYVEGTYELIVSVSDSFGNTASKNVKIIIKKARQEEHAEFTIVGDYTDVTYTSGQAPTLSLYQEGTFNLFVNGCSLFKSFEGDYVQYENIVYLISDSFNFSSDPKENVLHFIINLDGSLTFDTSLDLCAPNYGDLFTKKEDN